LETRLSLKTLRRMAIALVAVDLALLAALLVAVELSPASPGWAIAAALLSVAATLAIFALAWRATSRLEAARARSDAASARQREILDKLEAALVLYDPDDRIELVNDDFRSLYREVGDLIQPGTRFESLLRATVERQLIGAAQADPEAWIEQRLREHRQPHGPLVRQMSDGRWRRIVEQRLADGSLLSHSVDVSDLVANEEALGATRREAEQARQRLVDAIEALPDAFVYFDAEDRLAVCNLRYRELYRESAPAIAVGARFEELLRYGLAHGQYPQAAGRESDWLEERLQGHRRPAGPILQELPGNRWMRIDERITRDGGIAGVRTDVTELVRREQELVRLNAQLDAMNGVLARLSTTDELTGLANRRQFDQRLAEEVARAQRHGLPLALLMLDVDHFKRYNDRHGHPLGDACLRRVATLLLEVARRPSDLVARIGGEEFAILLPHDDAAEAQRVAEHCLAALDAAAIPHGDSPVAPQVTMSIGVADLSSLGDGASAAALVAAADNALYRAKQIGRHRAVRDAA
jgi:diguanylate cyclase (GGDEF)-like protein